MMNNSFAYLLKSFDPGQWNLRPGLRDTHPKDSYPSSVVESPKSQLWLHSSILLCHEDRDLRILRTTIWLDPRLGEKSESWTPLLFKERTTTYFGVEWTRWWVSNQTSFGPVKVNPHLYFPTDQEIRSPGTLHRDVTLLLERHSP